MEAEGILPPAGALGKGHAALARPESYKLNGNAPLVLERRTVPAVRRFRF